MPTITFLRGWQGRSVGSIDSRLPLGIMKTLVMAGTAKFTGTTTEPAQIQRIHQKHRGKK
jgi:hypothetical protein